MTKLYWLAVGDEPRYWSAKLSPMFLDGEFAGSVAVIRDITKRKQAEEEIAHGHRLLLALGQAAQAVQRARTPEEVYRAVGDEVTELGYHAIVFGLTDDHAHLAYSYMTFEPAPLRAAEKLVGIQVQGLRFEVVPGGIPDQVITGGRAIFFERIVEPMVETLPMLARPLIERIAATLGVEQAIYAPMRIGDEAHGLLVIAGVGLTEADVPAVTVFANQAAIALQNALLFEEVRAGRERLQALSRQLVEMQETERRHIARELHDEIGQILTGLKLVLDMSSHQPAGEARASLDEALALVNELVTQVRDLSLDLRPAMLDDLGLLAAFLWYFERYTARTNVRVSFKHAGLEERRFAPEVETAAYRVVQEALTNVARHADVSEVMVRLWADQDTLGVQVEDRGTGFDPDATLAAGVTGGLLGMRERVALLGGQLTIESHLETGTLLTAEFPLGDAAQGRSGEEGEA